VQQSGQLQQQLQHVQPCSSNSSSSGYWLSYSTPLAAALLHLQQFRMRLPRGKQQQQMPQLLHLLLCMPPLVETRTL
jgi:hypothetical protein